MKGLFINNKKAKDSIFESGRMVYQSLLLSNAYTLDYQEVDINDRVITTGYDFYFFNYHPATMRWLQTKKLQKQLGFVITMILEVADNDPFVMCPSKHFNFYCALDPTVTSKQKNLHAFPRPLEKIDFKLSIIDNPIPVIGSFGFATKGKGFQHVVEAVNKEFDKAIVKINIPHGDFVPESKQYACFLGELCKKKAKPGIEVQITYDFMSKEALINWCAANTLNCFLYDRNMPGLSATTDQAIVSGRPLSVSNNDTFRHITAYLPPYPIFSLKDSIQKSVPIVNKMAYDWQPKRFAGKFEGLLNQYQPIIKLQKKSITEYILPIKEYNIFDTLNHRINKYKRKFRKLNIRTLLTAKSKNEII
ncbi:hypothetical protein [Ferruginibacter sp.]|uniref:hypothetical protein n=1 Tax=Ferruginibacter sp. TaxID=1940288 RepID=UPI00374DB81B